MMEEGKQNFFAWIRLRRNEASFRLNSEAATMTWCARSGARWQEFVRVRVCQLETVWMETRKEMKPLKDHPYVQCWFGILFRFLLLPPSDIQIIIFLFFNNNAPLVD